MRPGVAHLLLHDRQAALRLDPGVEGLALVGKGKSYERRDLSTDLKYKSWVLMIRFPSEKNVILKAEESLSTRFRGKESVVL